MKTSSFSENSLLKSESLVGIHDIALPCNYAQSSLSEDHHCSSDKTLSEAVSDVRRMLVAI